MGQTGRMRTRPASIGATPRLAIGVSSPLATGPRMKSRVPSPTRLFPSCRDPIHHGLEKWKGNLNQVSIYDGEGGHDRGWVEEAIHAPNRNTCNQVPAVSAASPGPLSTAKLLGE